jgi:hypothetical protein
VRQRPAVYCSNECRLAALHAIRETNKEQKASSLPDRIRDFYIAQHKGIADYHVELKRLEREKDLLEWVESLKTDVIAGKWKSAKAFFEAPSREDPRKTYGALFIQNHRHTNEELQWVITKVDT